MRINISPKTILLLSTISFLSYSLHAQEESVCPNLNFSELNFTNWVCKVATSRISYSTAYQYLKWKDSTPVFSRHTIMSDIYGYDPHTCNGSPNKLALVPDGFHQSARIGNDSANFQADAIIYEMTVDSNNDLLLLHFAVVFYDPGHPQSKQPYFELRIQDTNGNLLNVDCNSYAVACAEDIPGFQYCDTNIRWRDWTTVGVNLSPLIGQTIYIVIATADCGAGAHFGYGYAVGECRPMKIDIHYCESALEASLVAPEGFVSYKWYNQIGVIVGIERELVLQNPPDGETYTVTMTSAIGCTSTLSCLIEKTMIAPDFIIDSLTNLCYPTKVHLAQTAYTSRSKISYWEWNISKISEDKGTEFISRDSSLSYQFQDTGHYKILLTVFSENGCVDTASAIVYSYPDQKLEVLITAPDLICKFTETEIFASGAATYRWEGVKRKITDTSAIIDRGGMYTVKGSDNKGCFDYDTVYVDDLEFEIEYTTTDNPCYGYNTGTIKISKIKGEYLLPLSHYWADLGYTGGIPTDNRNELAAGFYMLYAEDDRGCFRYDTIEIKEPEDVTIVFDTLVDEICHIPGYIKVHAKGGTSPYTYLWTSNQFPSDEHPNPPVCEQNIKELTHGFYTVTVIDNNKCPEKVKTYEVELIEEPVADFVTESYNVPINVIFTLTDNSKGNPIIWLWDLDNGKNQSGNVVRISFTKVGDYYVTLYIEDPNGCIDSITKKFHIYDDLRVYIPNAFTPNEDGINDVFKPEMSEYVKEGYVFEIFNRKGEKIFTTSDTEVGWDGKIDGKLITTTTIYSYRVVVKDFSSKDHEFTGHVTLLK